MWTKNSVLDVRGCGGRLRLPPPVKQRPETRNQVLPLLFFLFIAYTYTINTYMNTLIITANSKKENHSALIANTYKEEKEKKGDTVDIWSLYDEKYMLPYLTFDEHTPEYIAKINMVHARMMEADEIVFVHPIWWSLMPAIMKNFLDTVLSPHFAYLYDKGNVKPMLTGKTAKIFATAGSHAPYFTIPIVREFTPLFIVWKYAILGFCGMKVKSIMVCDKMNINDSCPPEGCVECFLEKVKRSARE